MRHLLWLLVALAAVGCELPKNVVRPPSSALVDTHHTLGGLTAPATAKHPGESGFLLFNTGEGAIQARVAMADLAQSSIDAMYFQWGRDAVGRVLLDRVTAAADRGVRVRLLIDDYYASGYDLSFGAIDAHPNMEVRVFNPYVRGRMRVTQLLGRFTELNRRMHNKLFVADGQLAIVGGRNLIDDYFGLGEEICYRDFDLLAIGQWCRRRRLPSTNTGTASGRIRSARWRSRPRRRSRIRRFTASRNGWPPIAPTSPTHCRTTGTPRVPGWSSSAVRESGARPSWSMTIQTAWRIRPPRRPAGSG